MRRFPLAAVVALFAIPPLSLGCADNQPKETAGPSGKAASPHKDVSVQWTRVGRYGNALTSGDGNDLPDSERALVRSLSSTGHWTSTEPWPSDYSLEWVVGWLEIFPLPGTHPLYECGYLDHNFISYDAGCEGWTYLGFAGYAFDGPDSADKGGGDTAQVYRCFNATADSWAPWDHMVSFDPDCESSGYINEGSLGYLAQ